MQDIDHQGLRKHHTWLSHLRLSHRRLSQHRLSQPHGRRRNATVLHRSGPPNKSGMIQAGHPAAVRGLLSNGLHRHGNRMKNMIAMEDLNTETAVIAPGLQGHGTHLGPRRKVILESSLLFHSDVTGNHNPHTCQQSLTESNVSIPDPQLY